MGALLGGARWVTLQIAQYEELGDFLIRLGLSWLFLASLSFLAFSSIVTSLSTFFLSDDLRLLLAAPVAGHRMFYARFAKTLGQASWMVVALLAPILIGVGLARSAPVSYYATGILTIIPFVVIPVAVGTAITLLLVNIFPARRARDLLMLMGLVFAGSLVFVLRYIEPEQLLRVESLPRRHGVLFDAPVAGDPAVALVLGRRGAVCIDARCTRFAARRRTVVDSPCRHRIAACRERSLVLHGIQQGPGSAQGPVRSPSHSRTTGGTPAHVGLAT